MNKLLDSFTAFEPTISEDRTVIGNRGFTPLQYLNMCAELEPLPNADALGDALLKSIDIPPSYEKTSLSLIAHGNKTKKFLETLKLSLTRDDWREVSHAAFSLISNLSRGKTFSKNIGFRVNAKDKADNYAAAELFIAMAKSCFSRPAAQVTFLSKFEHKNKYLMQLILAAAARIELECGRVAQAAALALKANTLKSAGVFISILQREIDIEARKQGLDIHLCKHVDDMSEYFCPIPFVHLHISGSERGDDVIKIAHPCNCVALCAIDVEGDNMWNSIQHQQVRKSIHDGNFIYCSYAYCPGIVNKSLPKKSEISDPYMREIIDKKLTVLDKGPVRMNLTYDRHCNLKCPSCRSDFKHLTPEQVIKLDAFAEKEIFPILENVEHLTISGSGEALSSPHSRKVIEKLSPSVFPKLRVILRTNGANITRENWEALGDGRKCIEEIIVSIDGGNKETFEKLRYPAKWEKLNASMEFIRELKSNGEINFISVAIVVQADNYMQLGDILHLCRNWHVDCIRAFRIRQNTSYPLNEYAKVNIFDPSHPEHSNFISEIEEFRKMYSELEKQKDELIEAGTTLPNVTLNF